MAIIEGGKMAEPSGNLEQLARKIGDLEKQLREFLDPEEISGEELKAYRRVKLALESTPQAWNWNWNLAGPGAMWGRAMADPSAWNWNWNLAGPGAVWRGMADPSAWNWNWGLLPWHWTRSGDPYTWDW